MQQRPNSPRRTSGYRTGAAGQRSTDPQDRRTSRYAGDSRRSSAYGRDRYASDYREDSYASDYDGGRYGSDYEGGRYASDYGGDRYASGYGEDRYASGRDDSRYASDYDDSRYGSDYGDSRYDSDYGGDRYSRDYGRDRYARDDGDRGGASSYGSRRSASSAYARRGSAGRSASSGYGSARGSAGRQTASGIGGGSYRQVPSSRQEYEAMQRRRLIRRLAPFAALAALAVVLIIAVVLILRPKAPSDVTAAAPADTETVETAGENGDAEATLAAAVTPGPTVVPATVYGKRSVHLRVVGDIMMCSGNLDYAARHDYDFHDQFSMITDTLSAADYTMGNMEGTVGKYNTSRYSGYPQFNCPETILETLKDSGIDFLTLANNHMLDRWTGGLLNTVDWVEKYGLDHVGGYRTQEEKSAPVVYDVGGIKFGFLAYTHSTNTMEKTTDPEGVALVPYISKANFEEDVKKLRDAGAEVVVAWPHWGKEYIREPDSSQKDYAKKLARAGVDIILGSHSHMVQPMGFQNITDVNGKAKTVFCIFSLGNFISDHTKQYCDNGVVLDFTVNEHEDGTFTVDDVGYIPTFTWKQYGGVRVMPSGPYLTNRPEGMSDEIYDRMRESYDEIVEVLGTNFRILDA